MFETTQTGVDVGIMTRNIEAMKAFYRDVLGLEEVDVREIPADFLKKLGVAKGGARLHVLRFGEMRFKLLELNLGNAPSEVRC